MDRGISGAKGREHRPAFDRLWRGAARKDFDVVMVWAVDRLGRSLQHLVEFLSELHSKRIDLLIHQQGIDTTTPGGKALFGMLGVFAEFERSMIQERVRAGIKRVRANDPEKLWGRKPYEVSDPELVAKVLALRKQGLRHAAHCEQGWHQSQDVLAAVASRRLVWIVAYHHTPAAPPRCLQMEGG